MQKIHRLMLCVVAAGYLLVPATARAQACGAETSTPLLAGQTMPAGTVNISNDANFIYVQYVLSTPWVMSDAHVAVTATVNDIPQTKTKNPIPGRFPYSATFDPEMTSYTFVVPMAGTFGAGQSIVVAAHALVQAPKSAGGSQTAWGFGPDFAGANWATYITYQIQGCGSAS